MAGRMARRRQNSRVIAQNKIVGHDVRFFSLNHRQYAVDERRHFSLRVRVEPIVVLALGEHIAGVGEGRHPSSVFQPRIPADVVDMQVRAHHEVDVCDREARSRERAHIAVVRVHVPLRTIRPRLVVTDATIDQHSMMWRLHDVGLEAQDERVGVVERTGLLHPSAIFGEHVRRQIWQHVLRLQERGFLLDDAMDREVTDGKFQFHDGFLRVRTSAAGRFCTRAALALSR